MATTNSTLTEDQVRDKARKILALEDTETAQSGVGQLTSFKKLGFSGTGANNPRTVGICHIRLLSLLLY